MSDGRLSDVARGLAGRVDLWSPHVRHEREHRTYAEIHRDEDISAWLICWMPGHDTGFHDHDGSGGAVQVLTGVIAEERLRIGGAPHTRWCGPGEGFSFAGADIHRVRCPGPHPAVTLHVYSPVLVRSGAYVIAPDGSLQRRSLRDGEELRPLAV